MASIKLVKVTCIAASVGRIQLRVGPHPLLPFTQVTGEITPLTSVPFDGTVAIDLYDESDGNNGVNSVASTTAITIHGSNFGSKTISYDNGVCSGQYLLTYEVSIDDETLAA